MISFLPCLFKYSFKYFPTNMPALARRRANAVYSIGPMLAKHSGPALARHRLHSGAILAQCRHFVICRNDAVMRPVYIKQYWLYTGKTASAQYRPITLQYRPDAGPMLYAELAQCWQSTLAWHWPGTVCIGPMPALRYRP